MALAGKQAGGRIETDPARARKIDLGPGMKVGEIVVGARRAVERNEVRLQLNKIAGDEARRETQMAQDLDERPGRIAARPEAALEGFFRALHARLHADDIFDLAREAPVEVDHEIDGVLRGTVDSVEKRLEPRPGRLGRRGR